MNKGRLWIVCGLPRSGKSSWANKYWTESSQVIVSGDNIRLAISGERYNSYINEYFKTVYHTMINSLFISGYSVLAEDCHTKWDEIKPLLRIDPDAEFIFFPNNLQELINNDELYNQHIKECKKRAVLTNQSDLTPAINRIASNLYSLFKDWNKNLIIERENARMYNQNHRIQER